MAYLQHSRLKEEEVIDISDNDTLEKYQYHLDYEDDETSQTDYKNSLKNDY